MIHDKMAERIAENDKKTSLVNNKENEVSCEFTGFFKSFKTFLSRLTYKKLVGVNTSSKFFKYANSSQIKEKKIGLENAKMTEKRDKEKGEME